MSLYFLQGYSGTCIVWSWNSFCQRIGGVSLIACWLSNTQWKRRWSVAEEYSMSWSWKCAGDRSYDGKCSPCVPAQHTRNQGSLLLSHALWETLPSSQYSSSLLLNFGGHGIGHLLSYAIWMYHHEQQDCLFSAEENLTFHISYWCMHVHNHLDTEQLSKCHAQKWDGHTSMWMKQFQYWIWVMHSKVGTWSILSYLRPFHCRFWACW